MLSSEVRCPGRMRTLEKLTVRNFKSIRDQTLNLGSLNVFIGGNGSGKSNLIEVFRFLREIVDQNLGRYTAKKGGADALLHFGRKISPSMAIRLEFGEGDRSNAYEVILAGTPADELIVAHESSYYHERTKYNKPFDNPISSGAKESKLKSDGHISARQVTRDLEDYRVYHFHDTSESAPMRGVSDVDDNRFLRAQAENLAAFLYWLQEKQPNHAANIQETIRQIAPFFDRFRLAPLKLNPSKIRLEWAGKRDRRVLQRICALGWHTPIHLPSHTSPSADAAIFGSA